MKEIAIVWESRSFSGGIDVSNGTLSGNGSDPGSVEANRLNLSFAECNLEPGPQATIVTVRQPETHR